MKCSDCKYSQTNSFDVKDKTATITVCNLTRTVMNPDAEWDCECFNEDLTKYNICYNCRYYRGGGDWGLFCSHKDKYHHLGKFNDEPCEHYEKKEAQNK